MYHPSEKIWVNVQEDIPHQQIAARHTTKYLLLTAQEEEPRRFASKLSGQTTQALVHFLDML